MKYSPTLTADEFRDIHNGICDIQNVIDRLEEVLKPELYETLVNASEQIRQALARAYAEEDAVMSQRREHYAKIRNELQLESFWSDFSVDNFSDRHPFEGADRIVYKNHWGEKPVSCSINGLTWLALYVAANSCIRDSDDTHHIFIENFIVDPQDPRTLLLITGS